MTILHFRAVIDGVDASRRNLDLDASSFLSFLSFPTLIQLVPTQTRRARLPVCARKPLGGQVLFIARTLSRPVVVDVVDAVVRTRAFGVVLRHRRRARGRQLHIHQRLRRRRLARGRRAHRQRLRTLESRRRVFAVVSTARRVDGASSPVSSRSRSRARVLIATFSVVDLARASSVHYVLNARDTVIARARRVLSTASSFCARATRHLDFETMRESRVASPKTKTNRRARTKNERHASQR